MKNLVLFLLFVSAIMTGQNVGIKTTSPQRTLDVNGNVRITGLADKTGDNTYSRILSANTSGDVEYREVQSLIQTEENNVEVRRSIYNASSPIEGEVCNCGDFTFRIAADNEVQFKLNSSAIFTANNVTQLKLGYGVKNWNNTTYSYVNSGGVLITNNDFSNWKKLSIENFPSANAANGNTVRIYTILPPNQGSMYRLTATRLRNDATNFTYGLLCERFYVVIK